MKRTLLIRNWTLYLLIVGGLLVGATALNMVGCEPAHASMECPADSGMDTEKAIHAIANEARNDPNEMRAVAWAIANRGRWQGVYGLRKPLIASQARLEACLRAWTEVGEDNLGQDHWLSAWDLKNCRESLIAWRHKMTMVGKFGNTTFYKA